METYRVTDNSYQLCLDTQKNERLAGSMFDPATDKEATVTVVAQPFDMQFKDPVVGTITRRFIIGKDSKGRNHLILFHGTP